MKLQSQDLIDQPLAAVYQTVRDDLVDLGPYFPNIEKIIQESKQDRPEGPAIVNRWYAKAELPTLLKKFFRPEFMSWLDHASWDDQNHKVTYKLTSPVGANLFSATGENNFEAKGKQKTLVTVTCHIELHPENVPGVPNFLAKKITPAVEALLKKILTPNLTALAAGLKAYYDNQ